MPRGGAEHVHARREEILTACERLYAARGFKDVTIKDIGEHTSFTRTSIYNYFVTKEEIFLALLGREYAAWEADLRAALASGTICTRAALADVLSETLARRETMLRLMSTSLFEMEANSRVEALADFKRTFGAVFQTLDGLVAACCPELDEPARGRFLYAFMPFVYGVWPYCTVTEKQRAAMKHAGLTYEPPTIRELVRCGAAMLLQTETP